MMSGHGSDGGTMPGEEPSERAELIKRLQGLILTRRSSWQSMQRHQFNETVHTHLGKDQPLQPLPQLCKLAGVLLPALYHHHYRISSIHTRYSKCQGISRAKFRLLFHNLLQVLRPDIASVDDDQIFLASRDHESRGRLVADIARVQPAIRRECLCGNFRFIEVSRHDTGCPYVDHTDVTLRHHLSRGIPHLHFERRQRHTTVHKLAHAFYGRIFPYRLRAFTQRQLIRIDTVNRQALIQRCKTHRQRTLRHPVTGHKRLAIKSAPNQRLGFIGHAGAKLSGSGVAVGIQSKGTVVIHQRDLDPLENLELFPQAPNLDLENYRQIGRNAARYALGKPVSPVAVNIDNTARLRLIVQTTLLQHFETQQIKRDQSPMEINFSEWR